MKEAGFVQEGGEWYDGKRKMENGEIKDTRLRLAAAEYTLNSVLCSTSLPQAFYGEPALFYKGSVEKTLIEYSKRLAKDIAPGRDGEWTHSPSYRAITMDDYMPIIKELDSLPGYREAVNGSDAQSLTTVAEHLNTLYAYGQITEKQ